MLPAQAVWGRTLSWLRSTWCVINGGHYKVLHTEPEKLALRCVACGHTSPGWEVGAPASLDAWPPIRTVFACVARR